MIQKHFKLVVFTIKMITQLNKKVVLFGNIISTCWGNYTYYFVNDNTKYT